MGIWTCFGPPAHGTRALRTARPAGATVSLWRVKRLRDPSEGPLRALGPAPTALWLAVALSACTPRAPDPGPLVLARGFEPSFAYPREAAFGSSEGIPILASSRGPGGDPADVWLRCTLPPEAWVEVSGATWMARRPLGNTALRLAGDLGESLAGSQGAYTRIAAEDAPRDPAEAPTGSFSSLGDHLYLRLGPGERPSEVTYAVRVPRGAERDGAWRLGLGQWSTEGIPVFTGGIEHVALDVPPASTLHVATLTISPFAREANQEGFFGAGYGRSRGEVTGRVRFVVELDGEPLLDHEQQVWTEGAAERHAVPLPDAGRDGAELTFRVEGDAMLGGFLTPRIAPSVLPAPAERTRPDLFLFLADTFRADNVTAYGGKLELTPHIDAFAERALVFERAWSAGGWTLPSQATMLSGLWPLQHGAVASGRAIPAQAQLISELLAAHGWRCGAVTDGALITRANGFDQGFEWFDERFRPLDATIEEARAFLEADDGRPVFLFVHTYRAHHPYRVSEETLAAHGARLGIDRTWDEAIELLEGEPASWRNHEGPLTAELRDALRSLEALYRGGAIDLDRGFGAFLGALEESGRLVHGHLLFTSDHGEGFGEHDLFRHDGGVYEEQVRIPMILGGGGITPGRRPHAAGLVDVARTFAALAALDAPDEWRGEALTELGGERPMATFETGPREARELALVRGDTKLYVRETDLPDPELVRAFDLDADAGERAPLAEREAEAAARLLAELVPWLGERSEAVHPPEEARAGRAADAALRALGYLDADH